MRPPPPFPALDGIRGVAIVAVMVYHLLPRPGVLTWPLRAVELAGRLGWVGVDLFFVLSGFLITGILLDARDAPHRWRTFLTRRALRIFPLYYAAVLLLAVLLPHVAPVTSPTPAADAAPAGWLAWLLAYGVNIRMGCSPLFHGTTSIPAAAWHFWSLAVEEQFYLIWPFVVWALTWRGLARACAALVGVATLVRVGAQAIGMTQAGYMLLPARMDALVVGGLLALALRMPAWWTAWRRVRWRVGATAFGLFGLLVARVLTGPTPNADLTKDAGVQIVGFTALAVAAAAWIASAVDRPSAGHSWLARGPLPWVGRYAYGLYVWHAIVGTLVLPRLVRAGWAGPSPDVRPWWGMAARLGSGVGLSVVAALASYHGLEAPFLRLKRYFPTQHAAGRMREASPGMPAAA